MRFLYLRVASFYGDDQEVLHVNILVLEIQTLRFNIFITKCVSNFHDFCATVDSQPILSATQNFFILQ